MTGRDQSLTINNYCYSTLRFNREDTGLMGVPHPSEMTRRGEMTYPSKAPDVAADVYSQATESHLMQPPDFGLMSLAII